MNVIYALIPLALLVLAAAVWALIWAIRNRQFDDLDAQAWSVVLDDDTRPPRYEGEEDKRNGEPNGEADR